MTADSTAFRPLGDNIGSVCIPFAAFIILIVTVIIFVASSVAADGAEERVTMGGVVTVDLRTITLPFFLLVVFVFVVFVFRGDN
jgi:hypothetical protein